MSIVGKNIPLQEELRNALPQASQQQLWDSLQPHGKIDVNKAEVTFKDSRRVLVHNRKDMPGLPLAAEGDGIPSDAKVTKNGKVAGKATGKVTAKAAPTKAVAPPKDARKAAPPPPPPAKAAKPAAPARSPAPPSSTTCPGRSTATATSRLSSGCSRSPRRSATTN